MGIMIRDDDIHRIFKAIDRENRGSVSTEELHLSLDRIGILSIGVDDLERLIGAGKNLDYFDFYFFYETLAKKTEKEEEEEEEEEEENHLLEEAFKVFDLNSDGYISGDELRSVLGRLGLWEGGADSREMIRVYDRNSDGVLDFHEFKTMMIKSR